MASESRTSAGAFAVLRVRVRAAEHAERVAAEAYAAGASGLEERDEGDATTLLLYMPAGESRRVRAAVASVVPEGMEGPFPVEATDWSARWKADLVPIVVSERLLVRPSFVAQRPAPGQHELVIDPGQAFGTGGHESTLLALEALDGLGDRLCDAPRVLDVGTGTGILALAALRLGAASAVGLDLDPLAAEAARHNAAVNGLSERLHLFTGPIDAVAELGFALVLANLLRRELLPLMDAIARRVDAGGRAVFAGLLARERSEIEAAARRVGLEPVAALQRDDANGERWVAIVTRR